VRKRIYRTVGLACLSFLASWSASAQSPDSKPPRFHEASNLPDLSGLAWLEGNRFLAVHDAKVEGELSNPRVSLIELPVNSKGLRWQERTLHFNELRSNDLESAARIPGTLDVLLVESGDSLDDPTFQRIFKARVIGNSVQIVATAQWPVRIHNVEASAVVALGPQLVFLFAERAQNLPSTELRWALFDPETLRFGSFNSVSFPNPNPAAFNRPLVGMDVDSAGQVYIVAAFDAEAAGLPEPDNGPFASAVYRIGVVSENGGVPIVRLFDSPELEGMMDGFKVESVAIREDAEHGLQIFIGLDDENYGATLRLLPPPPKGSNP
jgi:hypothetical protein